MASETTLRENPVGQVSLDSSAENECNLRSLRTPPQCNAIKIKKESVAGEVMKRVKSEVEDNLIAKTENSFGDFGGAVAPVKKGERGQGHLSNEDESEFDSSQDVGDGDVNTIEGVIVDGTALNSSLAAIQNYESSDSESESARDEEVAVEASTANLGRARTRSSESSTSDEDEVEIEEDSEDECSAQHSETESASERPTNNKNTVPPRKTGAVKKSQSNEHIYLNDVRELPPVPDISTLRIEEALEFEEMGHIHSILKDIVMVDSNPGTLPFNAETVLFMDTEGTPLGFIEDVIGNVQQPMYVVRFPSEQDLKKRNFVVGQKIYVAPKSSLTKYVFVQHLLKIKGTDASWIDDTEVPQEFADYSDDESEFVARNGNWSESEKRHSSSSTSSLERYKRFEQSMNIENEVNTRIHKIRDAIVTAKRRTHRHRNRLITQTNSNSSFSSPVTTIAVQEVPIFNPAIPPPPLTANIPRAVIAPQTIFNPVLPPPPPFTPLQPGPSMQAFTPPNLCAPPPTVTNSPWPNAPVMMCSPLVPPMSNAYGLFNTSSTFRPMAAIRSPNSSNGFQASGSAVRPPNFTVPPRMAVTYQLGPPSSQMQGGFQPLNVIGSTNMGTGGRYYDMWIPNQSPPSQWPYSMPYVGINMSPPTQQPPPTLHPQPPQPLPAISPQPSTLIHRPPSAQSPVSLRHPLRQTRPMQPITEQRYQRPQLQHHLHHQSNSNQHDNVERQRQNNQPQPKQ